MKARFLIPETGKAFLEVEGTDTEIAKLSILLRPHFGLEASGPQGPVVRADPPSPGVVEERLAEFWMRLDTKAPQRALIALLKARPGSMSLPELAKELGYADAGQIAGVIGGVRRNTKAAGFQSSDSIIMKLTNGSYKAGPVLRAHEMPAVRKSRWDHINEEEAQ